MNLLNAFPVDSSRLLSPYTPLAVLRVWGIGFSLRIITCIVPQRPITLQELLNKWLDFFTFHCYPAKTMTSLQESGRSPERPLEGKVVVITGGSRGIGAATALAFAQEGANLVISSTQNSSSSALQVVQGIEGLGQKALWVSGDIRDPATGELIIKSTVEKFGRLDVLVNNAGIKKDKLFVQMTLEDWNSVIGTNLLGPFSLTQAAAKLMMRQRSGSIIFISSPASTNAYIGQSNYTASKRGIEGWAETIEKELERFNVTVNVVAPGLVETALTQDLSDKKINTILANSPTGKLASMENVVTAIVGMAKSDKTGQRVEVW